MNAVILETAASQQFQQYERRDDSPGAWPIQVDRVVALQALHEASRHAHRLAHPLIASIVQPVPWRDPLAIYAAAQTLGATTDCFWEQPTQRRALVAIGAAATITTADSGDEDPAPTRSAAPLQTLQATAARWRELLADAHVIHMLQHDADDDTDDMMSMMSGPLCCGGFAFDAQAPHTALWDGFPAGLLVLPHLLFSFTDERATLTTNAVLDGSEDGATLKRIVERQAVALARLCASVELHDCDQTPALAPGKARLTELRSAAEWRATVAQATAAIRRGAYHKIVLARGVQAQAEQPFDVMATLGRLRARYPSACVFALRRGAQTFLGATPERLAQVAAGRVETMALAGTAPRGATEDADVALGRALLASAKNREEHAIVAATVREALAPLVRDAQALQNASEPQLLGLPNVQHLITPISAALRPGVGALEVAATLHPTPAVGGYPRDAALAAIRAHEGLDRGWYAGPVGWVGASGEGEFAVALRSALVHGAVATLFAGCGIVADSDPQAEYAESRLKLMVMLRGLGLDDVQQPHADGGESHDDA
ncbi:MAG: isochorismate synthase [Ktedonobacterales bacterium]